MPIQVRLTLAAFGLLVLVACGTSDAVDSPTAVDAPDIEVVVDMMSGVPNPTWTATGSDAAALVDMINALPDGGEIDAAAGLDLGFRGFVLRGLDLPGDATQVRVRGTEVVLSKYDTEGQLRTDPQRSIYTMLRTMSADHLDENLMKAIPVDGLKGS